MTGRKPWRCILVVLLPLSGLTQGRTWDFGISGGVVHNFRTGLHVRQDEQQPINLSASYATEPFTDPFYYDVKLSSWKKDKGFALRLTHHKLILKNRPPEVQRFSITDGFNLFTLNRAWRKHGFDWSLGAGVVITHPESTIRDKPFPENRGLFNDGYYISGPTIEGAIAKRQFFAKRWFVSGEGRASASYVKVPVSEGTARLSNLAVHLLIGLGYKF